MAKLLTDYKNIVTASGKSYKQVIAKSDGRMLWKAGTIGAIVTYMVDTASVYTEEVSTGESVLNPTTFTPSKDGWTFVGWREDTAANGDVLTDRTMDGEPITLYAVFGKECTLTAISANSTQYAYGTAYYNNGNMKSADVIAPTGATFDGWTWRGWSTGGDTSANASVAIANGDVVGLGVGDHTVYGLYEKTVTVTYYQVSDTTAYNSTGTKYYNAYGNTVNPTFTIEPIGFGSEWTFRGWTTSTEADAEPNYTSINNTEFSESATIYVLLSQLCTLIYDGGYENWHLDQDAMPQDYGYTYLNSYNCNTWKYATVTLAANTYVRESCVFTGWDLGAVGDTIHLSTTTYAVAQWAQSAYYYDYTGDVQAFTAPVSGTYKLQVWGAQGANYGQASAGGYGGYADGTIELNKGDILYIAVGGAGSFFYEGNSEGIEEVEGGYNGGGSINIAGGGAASGGGATHIARSNNRGVLANYADYKSEVLIVAGGGGGGSENGAGGTGGGTTGGDGLGIDAYETYATGGTQSSGGNGGEYGGNSGSFGLGGRPEDYCGWAGAGGGGYYGGGSGSQSGAGAGGSGYIGGVSNGTMGNGIQNGNGYATIKIMQVA